MDEEKTVTIKKSDLWRYATFVLIAVVVVGGFFVLRDGSSTGQVIDSGNSGSLSKETLEGSTFLVTGDSICTDKNGKPYVILFSTTWCPHCTWIKDTFGSLATGKYSDRINVQHWELDTGDNTLTPEIETKVPAEITALYQKYNPSGSIPTFVFGCAYYRVGNGYERADDLNAELEDFELVIGNLLK